jgi:hypothetical protein
VLKLFVFLLAHAIDFFILELSHHCDYLASLGS